MTADEAKSLGEAALDRVRAHVGYDDLDADFMIADLQTGLDMLHGMVLRLKEALRVSAEALSVQTALKRQAEEHAERQWNAALDEAAINCATATAVFDEETCGFFASMCRELKRPVGHESCPDSPCPGHFPYCEGAGKDAVSSTEQDKHETDAQRQARYGYGWMP